MPGIPLLKATFRLILIHGVVSPVLLILAEKFLSRNMFEAETCAPKHERV